MSLAKMLKFASSQSVVFSLPTTAGQAFLFVHLNVNQHNKLTLFF